MERGLIMFVHSVIITILLYLFMVFFLKQKTSTAENRSILIGAITLVYMILFGHGLPTRLNKHIL